MHATRLRAEHLDAPLALGRPDPSLSWWIVADEIGTPAVQGAYRVRAASSPEVLADGRPDLWDSGRVESAEQTGVRWGGEPLGSRAAVWWDVTLWDGSGAEGAPSEPAVFEVGLLGPSDWQASWIGAPVDEGSWTLPPAPLLRTTFDVERPVVRARLHVSALGLHVVHLNGQRVGDDWFRPGWTDYAHRVQHQTYDVTDLVSTGANALGAVLGDGWWSGRVGWHERGALYGTRPSLLAQIDLTHDDGSTSVVTSDESWRWRLGPIRGQDLIEGEEYDARHEVEGWDSVEADPTDAAGWSPVVVDDRADVRVVPSASATVRTIAEVPAVADPVVVRASGRTSATYDLGQNFTGVVRLRVSGPRGATLRLRYAEMLQPNGAVYTANLRSARAVDTYTLSGDPGGETWTPTFTFHGFRYVEVSHHDRWIGAVTLDRDSVTGLALSSSIEDTGSFECSDARLNQLQSNIVWGQRSNLLEVPTDCPQRDERLGWTGDAQVFAPTAAFNADVTAFFEKWSIDIDDAQGDDGRVPNVVPSVIDPADGGPGWSDARVLCAWAVHLAYGDMDVLERHYDEMAAWLTWQASSADGGVRCRDGCGYFQGYSDWLALDSAWQSVWSATPRDLIGTAYFASTAGVLAEIARRLGRTDDAARFEGWRATAVDAFQREFVTPSGRLAVQTQTAHLMALAWDLLPESQRDPAFTRLLELLEERGWHLSTGFLGTPLLCPVLSRFGRTDVAYRVLMSEEYPGWLFPVRNGATTMWERWNSWTPEHGFGDVGMNSFNHYAYGAIGRWMYDTIGGLRIEPDRPGYRHVDIRPEPGGGITWARTSIRSARGPVEVSWRIEGDAFQLDATVPPNATATCSLPDGTAHDVGPGTHTFTCPAPAPAA